MAPSHANRVFLFLQGPHGPFFGQLGRMLRAAGATTWRVGFNRGDQAFWPEASSYIPFTAPTETWPETAAALLDDKGVTDLVLYGDTRPIHAQAIAAARARGLTVHVFEEGYLRPTVGSHYERVRCNGHSRIIGAQRSTSMRVRPRRASTSDCPDAPALLGRTCANHTFFLQARFYHYLRVPAERRAYANFHPHRTLSVSDDNSASISAVLAADAHFFWLDRVQAILGTDQGTAAFPITCALSCNWPEMNAYD